MITILLPDEVTAWRSADIRQNSTVSTIKGFDESKFLSTTILATGVNHYNAKALGDRRSHRINDRPNVRFN
jgi:hypothetical protein